MALIKGPDGFVADVDSKNRLSVLAVSQSISERSNIDERVFSIQFAITPVTSDDFFFHFKNTGTKTILMNKIRLASTVPTQITIESVSGTPTFTTGSGAGTPATVTNRNLGSASTLSADAIADTDITVITSDGILFFEECSIADTRFTLDIGSGILIPQGQTLAFKRVETTGLIDALVTVIVAE